MSTATCSGACATVHDNFDFVISTSSSRVYILFRNNHSSRAATISAGSVIQLTEKVVSDEISSGFAVVRPPGHHAGEKAEGMRLLPLPCLDQVICVHWYTTAGFCFYNNVAIAARYANKKLGVKKVLILDWDGTFFTTSGAVVPSALLLWAQLLFPLCAVHHGNGTQDTFYDDPNILYISLHRFSPGFYPVRSLSVALLYTWNEYFHH